MRLGPDRVKVISKIVDLEKVQIGCSGEIVSLDTEGGMFDKLFGGR